MPAKHWLSLIVAVAACTAVPAQAANQTKVDLILAAETVRPGESVLAGLRMTMAPDWHTYWINPGEAGLKTAVTWQLPEGVQAGEIQWPVPEKYDWNGLFNYVYHHQAILLIPLSVAADAPLGEVRISGKVEWLECKEQCIPGSGEVSAAFTIGQESRRSEQADLIDAALKELPKPWTGNSARAWWGGPPGGDDRPLVVSWTPQSAAAQHDFYPYPAENYSVQTATEKLDQTGQRISLRKVVEKYEGAWPEEQGGLLVERDEQGRLLNAFAVTLPIAPTREEAMRAAGSLASPGTGSRVEAGGSDAGGAAVDGNKGGRTSLWTILGLAFLGGLVLNVMPCVLPVISLKILGFVNQSRQDPQEVRKLGMIYALGVVASFLVLAGLVIGVQQAGQVASWGMQFGNPVFLVLITTLVVLVALNLFGLFEVNLGGSVMGAAGTLASKEGPAGAFFNGVLATALATPCTAPFLSVALGFAFTKPPGIIVLTFVVVALGLAAPYVLLAMNPSWLKFLPKPGPWMERFKVAMGFPMLATAVWLFSILVRHFGQSGILWVGFFMVLVAMAAWVYGEFVQRSRRHPGWAKAVAVMIVALGYAVILEGQLDWRSPRAVSASDGVASAKNPDGIPWQPWSPEAVAAARAQGRPVLVDFTADWCATCKVNEKTSIEIPAVREKIREIGAVPLLADNTLLPQSIARELARFDRAGVPLVLVYPKDASEPPIVLPTLLTPNIVLNALEKAAGTSGVQQSAHIP